MPTPFQKIYPFIIVNANNKYYSFFIMPPSLYSSQQGQHARLPEAST
jgi:hypothetical protein